MSQGHELMWMDPADEKEEAGDEDAGASGVREGAGEKARQLEAELQAVRKELSDVRRDLAAKTIQLSKRDAKVEEDAKRKARAEAEEEARRKKEAEPKQPVVDVEELQQEIEALQMEAMMLRERLEDAEQTRAAQEKALREATAVAEIATSAINSEESARHAYEQQAEHEIDKLTRELNSLRNRSNLQLQQKAAEVSRMEAEVANAQALRRQAVREAEETVRDTWAAKVAMAEKAAAGREEELEQRIAELQVELADGDGGFGYDNSDILEQLANAQAGKAEIAREFEVFREMAGSTAREKSSEVARLLEENAALRARMANSAGRDYTSFGIDMPSTSLSGDHNQLRIYMERMLNKRPAWLGHRSIVMLLGVAMASTLVMFALLRALLSARGPNRWLCVLEKLGLTIGDGCLGLNSGHIEELIDEIIEDHGRI